MMLTRPSVIALFRPCTHVSALQPKIRILFLLGKIVPLSRSTMSAADEQQSLWLSAALVQADLSPYIADAAAWMRSEQAVIADFFCDATISDLGATLKLTKTQLRRLRSAIESLGPDTVPLPGNQVPQLYAPGL